MIGKVRHAIAVCLRNCKTPAYLHSIQQKLTGYIAIGSNGAGELFLMDTISVRLPVLMVPAINDDFRYAIVLGEIFVDFLEGICTL